MTHRLAIILLALFPAAASAGWIYEYVDHPHNGILKQCRAMKGPVTHRADAAEILVIVTYADWLAQRAPNVALSIAAGAFDSEYFVKTTTAARHGCPATDYPTSAFKCNATVDTVISHQRTVTTTPNDPLATATTKTETGSSSVTLGVADAHPHTDSFTHLGDTHRYLLFGPAAKVLQWERADVKYISRFAYSPNHFVTTRAEYDLAGLAQAHRWVNGCAAANFALATDTD